jgi:SAM-dependent methyltransferase
MKITKEQFYSNRGKTYPFEDPEAIVRYKKVTDWIVPNNNLSLREVGCKYSVLYDFLKTVSDNFDYRAVDIDLSTLKKIPHYNENEYICHNANKGLPFESSTADYIVCCEVLEHLENATLFFNEVERVLKPGGALILSVPNPYCWMEAYGNFRKCSDIEGHISTYTYQNITALLSFVPSLVLEKFQGTSTRIPFSHRLFGSYKIINTNNIFLTRSLMFLIRKT